MAFHDDPSLPYPPNHINEETHELIKKAWIRDCKEIACFHKCFMQVYDIIGDYWVEYDERRGQGKFYDISFRTQFRGDPKIPDIDGWQPILHDLLSNLESLIPGYFNKLSPSASDEEKFEKVGLELDHEWRWRDYRSIKRFKRLEGSDEPEPFHRTLARTLSELHYRSLTKTDSPRDLEGGPSLLQLALEQVLKQLSKSIEGEQATFSCGGSIAVGPPQLRGTGTADSSHNFRNSPPVTIYWSGDNEQLYKISLPCGNPGNKSPSQLDQLLASCTSGTFGPEGTLYRNSGAFDEDRFSTSFHPSDFGIINTIEQLLLPSTNSQSESQFGLRRIKAELYQLNVHSTASDVFRHADAPKSRNLFGFLVVCLPSPHEGGQLSICHNEGVVEFDWSRLSSSSIQWVAFYSDCEYKIGRISNGNLITLTYKLHVTEPIGGPLIQDPVVDVMSFPLYDLFKVTLENPAFLKNGGALGAFCSHPYPHTSDAVASGLPKALKGTDMALFSVLQSLGLKVGVVPILESGGNYSIGSSNLAIFRSASEGSSQRHYHPEYYSSKDDYKPNKYFDDFQNKRRYSENPKNLWHGGDLHLNYRYLFDDFNGVIDLESYWKILLLARRPRGLGRPTGSRVGHDLHPYGVYNEYTYGDTLTVRPEYWNFSFMPGITWLSSPKHEAPAFTCLPKGHKDTKTLYSCLAIIAIVPPVSERDVSIY